MKRTLAFVLCLALCLPLVACSAGQKKHAETYFDCFDSYATLTAYTKSESEWESYLGAFRTAVDRYHRLLDAYNSYDGFINIHTVNSSGGKSLEVSRELFDFLSYSKSVHALTGGYTSVSLGAVTSIWKSAIKSQSLPSADELTSASAHVDISGLVLDQTALTVRLTDTSMRLDAGALGKGYAAEMIRNELISLGCESFLIDLGGTLCAFGNKPDGNPWRGGVRSLDGKELDGSSVSISGLSLSTSGSYHRGFDLDGVRYHHIINPFTLYPENRFVSVSVLTASASDADALSTALFSMSLEDGQALVKSLSNTEALWLLPDGSVIKTDGFEK